MKNNLNLLLNRGKNICLFWLTITKQAQYHNFRWAYNPGQKLWPKLRKTALSLTPQAMYNQFKRPSAGSVSELYYTYRKT